MEEEEWAVRCSARLHARWPRIERAQRDEVAAELRRDSRWRELEPEQSVVEWLRQGITGER